MSSLDLLPGSANGNKRYNCSPNVEAIKKKFKNHGIIN